MGYAKTLTDPITTIFYEVTRHWLVSSYEAFVSKTDRKKHYTRLLENATTVEQWRAAGKELDKIYGRDAWKEEPHSRNDYDPELLMDRIRLLKKARESEDLGTMIFLLRTSLCRNIGDMGNPRLYGISLVGTKKLIENYIDEVCKQLQYICHVQDSGMNLQSKIDFFANTQRAFGRTALLLSGGATFGLTHLGVIKTLFENNLLPKIISGSSVGSIIASAICTRSDDEIKDLFRPENLSLDVFETKNEQDFFWHKLFRLYQHGVLFDVKVLIEEMKHNLIGTDMTFLEAYNRTRRVLNITVSSSTNYEMPRLLNYLTAPNVVIWSAVAASCSIPFIYRSATLRAKARDGTLEDWNLSDQRWIDGSVEGDLPIQRIAELFNVNHFIVSQVNPHIIPFMDTQSVQSLFSKTVFSLASMVRSEFQHRLNQAMETGLASTFFYKLYSILSQSYYGDITIVPQIPMTWYTQLVSNPTPEMVTKFLIAGEKATWPQLCIIKNHCQIELLLDDLLNALKSKKFDRLYIEKSTEMSIIKRPGPRLNEVMSDTDSDDVYRVYPKKTKFISRPNYATMSPDSTTLASEATQTVVSL